mmetsp:Transcript_62655/g.149460  ORF Transcript_62655/g.149460 Transcript_62655/m.149460 type:complete len:120 (-) Transcript_62655:208-567(-)
MAGFDLLGGFFLIALAGRYLGSSQCWAHLRKSKCRSCFGGKDDKSEEEAFRRKPSRKLTGGEMDMGRRPSSTKDGRRSSQSSSAGGVRRSGSKQMQAAKAPQGAKAFTQESGSMKWWWE